MEIIDTDKIKEAIDKEKQKGNTIALLHGCFDGLHEGHFALFSEAKNIANIVVVGIETDKYIQQHKGIHRPYFTLQKRINDLQKINIIDYAFKIPESNNFEIYKQLYINLKPDYLITAEDEILDKKKIDADIAGIELISIIKSKHSSRDLFKK